MTAEKQGKINCGDVKRIQDLIHRAGLPVRIAGISASKAIEAMKGDKKSTKGVPHFILPVAIGTMDDAVAVTLKLGTRRTALFLNRSPSRVCRTTGVIRQFKTFRNHGSYPSSRRASLIRPSGTSSITVVPIATEFQRDRDRIIHSSAFRRLEYKTQVFVNHEGDLFRTRLTHTLEVAQIARTTATLLKINPDLTEAIALAHDLGHTPFGHSGQTALDRCMADHGGFSPSKFGY